MSINVVLYCTFGNKSSDALDFRWLLFYSSTDIYNVYTLRMVARGTQCSKKTMFALPIVLECI